MLTRKVPKTGDELSILGFGCMRLPQKPAGGIDEDRAIRQIRYAIENGVNYFDTAPIYHVGRSEQILAKALADGFREKVRIATKLPPWAVHSRQDMDRILDGQLETLETDHIDYYLLHSLVKEKWEKLLRLGVLDFLDAAEKDGRIRNAGFSFHGTLKTFKEIVDAYDWQLCQIQYNYLDEEIQAGTEGLKYAASRGLAVMVMEPLRGGSLADPVPDDVKKIFEEMPIRRSPAEWGLRWVWDHPEVTVVLSGMNEEAHVRENIQAASDSYPNGLGQDERTAIANVRDVFRRLMKVNCTGCSYCMPCPFGVNIPDCFALYNSVHLFPHKQRNFRTLYLGRLGGIVGDTGYAGLCRQCGRCAAICPQHIPIPQALKEVSATMEGRGMWLKIRLGKAAFFVFHRVPHIRSAVKVLNG
ncbi:MAG: aldo/keto reductase [Methanolinea sp.]|nr:aldo/keto reductase [Methanolinea sp.]